jgi:uncharacterized protein
MEIELEGEKLELFAERALYWPGERTLFIADLHLGKAATFRHAGMPIPSGSTSEDLNRLSKLIDKTGATQLWILGDLIHARQGRSADVLASVTGWCEQHPELMIGLIRGNHDKHAGDPPEHWKMQLQEEPYQIGPFALCHYPLVREEGYVLAGHLHPSVSLSGKGRQRLRLPCFAFSDRVGILPAFGRFTGKGDAQPQAGDRIFVIADDQIVQIQT